MLLQLAVSLFLAAAPPAGSIRWLSTAETKAVVAKSILWDVRSRADYLAGHLPDAVNIDEAFEALTDKSTQNYRSPEQLAAQLGAAGIDLKVPTIVYGNTGSARIFYAARALHFLGAASVSVFAHGFEGWKAAGQPIVRSEFKRSPVNNAVSWNATETVTLSELKTLLREDEVQLVDARTTSEFLGKDLETLRGGHIPKAINLPFQVNWIDPNATLAVPGGRTFQTIPKLRALYQSAQLDARKRTIVYCSHGSRSAATAEVLKLIGFANVQTYEGGWYEYGELLDVPIEGETRFSVIAALEKIAALEARVKMLEGQLGPDAGR